MLGRVVVRRVEARALEAELETLAPRPLEPPAEPEPQTMLGRSVPGHALAARSLDLDPEHRASRGAM